MNRLIEIMYLAQRLCVPAGGLTPKIPGACRVSSNTTTPYPTAGNGTVATPTVPGSGPQGTTVAFTGAGSAMRVEMGVMVGLIAGMGLAFV